MIFQKESAERRKVDPFAQKDLEYVIKTQSKMRKKISKGVPQLGWVA